MVDRYSLTWGDYGTSLVSAVQLLRCHGDLVDVTLAAGGRSFSAHKIVLCAASPYLLDLLKNTTCKHPIVMLAGVNANDLEALLEFVYRGEVSVDHSQLPSLLQAAHCLNIQGLAPQTVTHKDDTTTAYTSIQIHPSLVQQDVKTHILDVGNNCTEEMITTIQTPSHQQMETQVVEEVIHQDPLSCSEDVTKDVINQFLPQRKRKPRAKRPSPNKMIKLEQSPSSSNMMTTTTTIIGSAQNQSQDSIVETLAEMEDTENENESEVKPEDQEINKALMTPSSKSDKASKSKAKSQSEQPATCPICSAVIRQSRNLRRHLELRHFKKRTPKKEPGSANTSAEQIITDSANGNQTITVTMAPNSDQQTITVNGQQQQQHVLTQHENPDGTTSLSITQVPGLQGHQIIGSLNNATIIRTEDGQQLDGNLITTHEASLRPHTELFRVGTTVYTIEERRPDPNRMS